MDAAFESNLSYVSKQDKKPFKFGTPPRNDQRRNSAPDSGDVAGNFSLSRSASPRQPSKGSMYYSKAVDLMWLEGYDYFDLFTVAEDDPAFRAVLVRNMRNLREFSDFAVPWREFGERPLVVWVSGGTGTGKTFNCARWAEIRCKRRYWIAPATEYKYMQGYRGQPCVIFDEFRPYQVHLAHFLRLLDDTRIEVEYKGSSIRWVPRIIFVTTPDPLGSASNFKGDSSMEDMQQLFRRVNKQFHLSDSESKSKFKQFLKEHPGFDAFGKLHTEPIDINDFKEFKRRGKVAELKRNLLRKQQKHSYRRRKQAASSAGPVEDVLARQAGGSQEATGTAGVESLRARVVASSAGNGTTQPLQAGGVGGRFGDDFIHRASGSSAHKTLDRRGSWHRRQSSQVSSPREAVHRLQEDGDSRRDSPVSARSGSTSAVRSRDELSSDADVTLVAGDDGEEKSFGDMEREDAEEAEEILSARSAASSANVDAAGYPSGWTDDVTDQVLDAGQDAEMDVYAAIDGLSNLLAAEEADRNVVASVPKAPAVVCTADRQFCVNVPPCKCSDCIGGSKDYWNTTSSSPVIIKSPLKHAEVSYALTEKALAVSDVTRPSLQDRHLVDSYTTEAVFLPKGEVRTDPYGAAVLRPSNQLSAPKVVTSGSEVSGRVGSYTPSKIPKGLVSKFAYKGNKAGQVTAAYKAAQAKVIAQEAKAKEREVSSSGTTMLKYATGARQTKLPAYMPAAKNVDTFTSLLSGDKTTSVHVDITGAVPTVTRLPLPERKNVLIDLTDEDPSEHVVTATSEAKQLAIKKELGDLLATKSSKKLSLSKNGRSSSLSLSERMHMAVVSKSKRDSTGQASAGKLKLLLDIDSGQDTVSGDEIGDYSHSDSERGVYSGNEELSKEAKYRKRDRRDGNFSTDGSDNGEELGNEDSERSEDSEPNCDDADFIDDGHVSTGYTGYNTTDDGEYFCDK